MVRCASFITTAYTRLLCPAKQCPPPMFRMSAYRSQCEGLTPPNKRCTDHLIATGLEGRNNLLQNSASRVRTAQLVKTLRRDTVFTPAVK